MDIPLDEIAAAYDLPAAGARAEPLGSGRINRTFLVHYPELPEPSRRVHQALNTQVFPSPEAVMTNLERVSAHLRGTVAHLPAAEQRRRVLTLIPTADGHPWHVDTAGRWWRTFHYVPGAVSHDRAPDAETVQAAARAYAGFSLALADLPPPPLKATLPGFHDTPRRLVGLEQALAGADPADLDAAAPLAEALLERRELAGLIPHALGDGMLPLRVCHNDTKLSNVLFDATHGEALCVVDLDTVMPGTVLHDFGDLVRSTAVAGSEEDPAVPATVDPARIRAAVEGYVGCRPGWLEPRELELLPAAPAAITLELAARFLTDHLRGDHYFPVEAPGDNLRRAWRQFRLLEALEGERRSLTGMVRAVAGDRAPG